MNKEKSVAKLLQEAQTVFNEFIRKRDEGKGCISCGAPYFSDCGHVFKISTRPAMRFNPMAAHGQCRECNSKHDGNYDAYCLGIAARYGINYLTEVIQCANESRKSCHKWSRMELQEIIFNCKQQIKIINSSK